MKHKLQAAAVAVLAAAAAVAAPSAAKADVIIAQDCRGSYTTGHAGVLLNPCVEADANDLGQGWYLKPYVYVTSPSTDVRVYIQTGTSANRTSPITWEPATTQSTVFGPHQYNAKWEADEQIYDYFQGCSWTRVWATDGGVTFAWDVESPPVCYGV